MVKYNHRVNSGAFLLIELNIFIEFPHVFLEMEGVRFRRLIRVRAFLLAFLSVKEEF